MQQIIIQKNGIHGKTKKMVLGGLFISLGVVFPFFTGHAFGLPGTVLLPMHIPVIMAGFLLGPGYGAMIGITTPILSSVLTGMPQLWPMLPLMIFELGGYGLATGILRRKINLPLYASLLGAMFLGRIARGIVFAVMMFPAGLNFAVESMIGAVITGLPGILVQLALIPAVINLLEKNMGLKPVKSLEIKKDTTPLIEEAIKEIKSGESTFVLIKNDTIIYKTSGRGVRPFLQLLSSEEGRDLLQDAFVVDKIIGKAAAMLAVLGKVKGVYGVTMSLNGKRFLEKNEKQFGFTRCVDVISNRQGRGICPIERSVMEIDDPQKGYEQIVDKVNELMKKAS